jgi:hypothetical protein
MLMLERVALLDVPHSLVVMKKNDSLFFCANAGDPNIEWMCVVPSFSHHSVHCY